MTDQQQQRVEEFIKNYDLTRMSQNVRQIFFDYLRQHKAGLPLNFDEVLYDIEALTEMLETVSQGH